MLRRFGVGAGEREDRVRGVGAGGPDLLAVDDVLVAVADRACLQRGEVGAGARFRVALGPHALSREDRREVLLALLLGAVDNQGRTEQADGGAADRRSRGFRHLLAEDELLGDGHAAAAVLPGPVRGDPSALGKGARPLRGRASRLGVVGLAIELPLALALVRVFGEGAVAGGKAFGDDGADLLTEFALLVVVVPVHLLLRRCRAALRTRLRRRL